MSKGLRAGALLPSTKYEPENRLFRGEKTSGLDLVTFYHSSAVEVPTGL
jgi:hypothetical protein